MCTIQRIASQPHERSHENSRDAWAARHGEHSPFATALKPSARKAEPRLGAVIAELGGTQFDNLESRFDGENDLTGRALRPAGRLRSSR
jgi:hypothetical protein